MDTIKVTRSGSLLTQVKRFTIKRRNAYVLSMACHGSFLNYPSIIPAVHVEHLSDAARSNQHALNKTQEEIGEYRRQLQSRTIELETLRGTKESLERQHLEYEERNHNDLNSLQVGN